MQKEVRIKRRRNFFLRGKDKEMEETRGKEKGMA